jgi:hypothetical protein
MFKKTGKTTTLGVTAPPKDREKQAEAKPKDDQTKKPQDTRQK